MFPALDREVITAVLRETRNDGKGNRLGFRAIACKIRQPPTNGVLPRVHQLVLLLKGCWRCHPAPLQRHLLPLRALSGHELPMWSNHHPRLGTRATGEFMGLLAPSVPRPTTQDPNPTITQDHYSKLQWQALLPTKVRMSRTLRPPYTAVLSSLLCHSMSGRWWVGTWRRRLGRPSEGS